MKKIFTLLLIVITANQLFSQTAVLTEKLASSLSQGKSTDIIKVNVVFSDQVHHGILNAEFKAQDTPLGERARTVIRESMRIAENSQSPVINYLNDNIKKVVSFKQLWIINMMTIEAEKSIIEELKFLPSIDYIEEFGHYKGKGIDTQLSKVSSDKSVGGIEPGLAAINAPALWAMGYTGKGRRYLSYDTGVWPTHPAISDNWLGNYQPIDQAWHGIDSPFPVDKGNAHGTHTTGTVLGLDPLTNDTIGVAFNAYFMATDPIVTNLALIKPLTEYIAVFQFALNPDGDTTTTNDIPDAINNSWGISGQYFDTSICSGYVTQMFDALEAAGIANVFSAGNNGPSDTTIGQPQYVSTGLVNTFTVGAVDGANPAFPITSFSSHGPTACNVGGSLKIKPEVVAPGLNVRSAVENNNYASYNGTSMAGPHATGAVLLLKEAYPEVSGEVILLALYNTASDLGVVGEDNTYGKGMIDVLAAYNELALTYTPTLPSQFSYDLYIQKISNPTNELECTQTFSPQIILENKGDSTISNATITYWLNNEPSSSFIWSGTLIAGDTTTVSLPTISALSIGDYELIINATIDTTKIECDYINNQKAHRFNIRNTTGILPFFEGFENMKLDSSDWMIYNPDNDIRWDTAETAGLPNSFHSASMHHYNYATVGELDGLVSEKITLPNQDSLFLKFEVAYQKFLIFDDTLSVYLSTDCGESYTEIYKKGGVNLETTDTSTADFSPLYSTHWRTEYVDITAFGNNDILLKFETFNRRGNNVFIDNIWLYEGVEPVSTPEYQVDDFAVYPNPTHNKITIDLGKNELENASIEIFDLLGKSLYKINVSQRTTTVNLNELSNGIYLIKFANNRGTKIIKSIKN